MTNYLLDNDIITLDDIKKRVEELKHRALNSDEVEELNILIELEKQCVCNDSNLIHENHIFLYIRDYCLRVIDSYYEIPKWLVIDWNGTVLDMMREGTVVEVGGYTYYMKIEEYLSMRL